MGKNIVDDVPWINNVGDLQAALSPEYIISDKFMSEKIYSRFRDYILSIVRGCYQIAECREYPVKFRFYPTSETHTLQLRHFLINLILWGPIVLIAKNPGVFTDELIFDCNNIARFATDYVDEIILPLLNDYMVANIRINQAIADVWWYIGNRISIDFSTLLNVNYTMVDFMNLYNSDEEIRKCMDLHLDENKQPAENELIISEMSDIFLSRIKARKDNGLSLLLRSGTGIKPKQLIEYACIQGYRPNLTGETIPLPLNSSIIRGLTKPSEFYMSAGGSRKSLVTNKKVMGTAGHFAKMVSIAARTIELSPTVSDCGSKHYVRYNITSKKKLEKLNGKFYKLTPDPKEDLMVLNAKKDFHLIGKTIYVRSVITCACQPLTKTWGIDKGKTTDVFCHKCFGTSANLNTDIPAGISVFESEEWTKGVQQNILSIKHLLITMSDTIVFNEAFHRFFSLTGQEITANVTENPFVPNIDDYAIYIDPESVSKVEELDDDSVYNTMIASGKFIIRNLKNSSEKDIEICTDGGKEIYITDYTLELLQKGKNLIKFSNLDDKAVLFEVIIDNNELTKPLYELMELINKKKELGTYTIDSVANRMIDLFVESGSPAHASAAEIILNRLIRDIDDIYERPDFRRENIGGYQMINLSKAIEKNPSPIIGLSTQYIKRQILDSSGDLFGRRTATSYLDELYLKEIPTDVLVDYTVKSLKNDGIEVDRSEFRKL